MTAVAADVTAPPDEKLVRERIADLLATHDPTTTDAVEFLGARYDAGLAWVWFREGSGGLGVAPQLQGLVDRELARAGAPAPDIERNIIGHGMGAPTVATHGTEEQ